MYVHLQTWWPCETEDFPLHRCIQLTYSNKLLQNNKKHTMKRRFGLILVNQVCCMCRKPNKS